jgi:hypothetical protein
MDSPHERTYIHRAKINGTFESICWECFAIVATARQEADLVNAESNHVCDPRIVEIFRKLHIEPSASSRSEPC